MSGIACWHTALWLILLGLGAGLLAAWLTGDLGAARLVLLVGASGIVAPIVAGWRLR
ncbi:MAG TPA: hypothetical protein VK066_22690 [Chloroflexota bacterium]|nr:hypothetical protein [Chloroflexota bacterium]